MSSTPDVVSRYLDAADAGDLDSLVGCFTDDGTVVDEGRTYRGLEQIRGWRESLRSRYEYTTTVTGAEPDGDSSHVVRARVEGNFPGGVVDLIYRFTLAGGLIADLTIL